ncbi:MAG: glutamate 5-kinase, partial [Candidatus Binatia bacterium]
WIISTIEKIDDRIVRMAKGTMSDTATGGMTAKLEAARIVTRSGIPLIIAGGGKFNVMEPILNGENEGTIFLPDEKKLKSRKRWIAFFHHPKGAVLVDEGAVKALRENGKSLLRPGIVSVEGMFADGDVVRICDGRGTEFARGIAAFDSKTLTAGGAIRGAVVHRDNLVIL